MVLPGLLQRELAVGVVAENRRQEGAVLVDPGVERTPMHRELPLWVMSDEYVIDNVGKKLGSWNRIWQVIQRSYKDGRG